MLTSWMDNTLYEYRGSFYCSTLACSGTEARITVNIEPAGNIVDDLTAPWLPIGVQKLYLLLEMSLYGF